MPKARNQWLTPILLAVAVIPAQAQRSPIEPKSVQLGGTASIIHQSRDGTNAQTTIELSPRVGYFVAHGLALNAIVRLARGSGGGTTSLQWGLGPGIAYYFRTPSTHLYPFASAKTVFTSSRITQHRFSPSDPNAEISFTTSNRLWALSAGVLFMLADHVGISGEFFYQQDHTPSRTQTGTGFVFGPSSAVAYGLQWGVIAFVR